MILVPLIMFPIMGFAIRTSIASAAESLRNVPVAIVDLDRGEVAIELIAFIKSTPNIKVIQVDASNVDEAIRRMQMMNATELLVIPQDFSEKITGGQQVKLEFYSVFTGKSAIEGARPSTVESILEAFKRKLAPDPFNVYSKSIVKGRVVEIDPQTLSGMMMSQFFAMPVTIMMMLMFAMQLAATSMASEKEEKTLETLLSLPINRFTILVGKLTGSVIVAAISSIACLIGFNYYMSSFMFGIPTQVGVDLAELGLAPTPLKYAILGVSLFVSLLSALALAVVLSAFAEDVRGAQALIGYLYPVFFVPMIILMFSDINVLPLPLRIILYAIPYTHPMLAARATITEDYLTPTLGILYVVAFTVTILYLAARFFATEKILTARLRFKGLKLRRPAK